MTQFDFSGPAKTGEFKKWDKEFSAAELESERAQWISPNTPQNVIDSWDSWPYPLDTWTRERIKFAVYDSASARWWQRFRVSLKGLTTQQKLYCLDKYLFQESGKNRELIKARVDNYIGALRRSGHLNADMKVVK